MHKKWLYFHILQQCSTYYTVSSTKQTKAVAEFCMGLIGLIWFPRIPHCSECNVSARCSLLLKWQTTISMLNWSVDWRLHTVETSVNHDKTKRQKTSRLDVFYTWRQNIPTVVLLINWSWTRGLTDHWLIFHPGKKSIHLSFYMWLCCIKKNTSEDTGLICVPPVRKPLVQKT